VQARENAGPSWPFRRTSAGASTAPGSHTPASASRPSPQDVLVVELGEPVVLEPALKKLGFEPAERGGALFALRDDDLLGFEEVSA
jgi:hypothetical protein